MKKLLNFLAANPGKIHTMAIPNQVNLASLFIKTDLGQIQTYEIDALMTAVILHNPGINRENLKVVDWESVVDNQLTSVYIRSDLYPGDVLLSFYVNFVPIHFNEDDNGNSIGIGETRTRTIKDFNKLYKPQIIQQNNKFLKVWFANGELKIHGINDQKMLTPIIEQVTIKVGDELQNQEMVLTFTIENRFAINSVIVDHNLGNLVDYQQGAILQKILNLNPTLQNTLIVIKSHDHLTHEIQIQAQDYYGFARFYYQVEDSITLDNIPLGIQRAQTLVTNFLKFKN